jgi:hypothetical protein
LAAAEAFSVEENTSYFIALYWAVTTVTTVGYGDRLPTTTEAEITAMIVMLVGIGFFAALAGALANLFIEGRAHEIAEAERHGAGAATALVAGAQPHTPSAPRGAPCRSTTSCRAPTRPPSFPRRWPPK